MRIALVQSGYFIISSNVAYSRHEIEGKLLNTCLSTRTLCWSQASQSLLFLCNATEKKSPINHMETSWFSLGNRHQYQITRIQCIACMVLKSDSTHHFFRNACTKSGSLRFSQLSRHAFILENCSIGIKQQSLTDSILLHRTICNNVLNELCSSTKL
jgi:hypothetical protein